MWMLFEREWIPRRGVLDGRTAVRLIIVSINAGNFWGNQGVRRR